MDINKVQIEELIAKLYDGTISQEESELLFHWFQNRQETSMEIPAHAAGSLADLSSRLKVDTRKRIVAEVKNGRAVAPFNWRRLMVAAAAVILIGSGSIYVYLHTYLKQPGKAVVPTASTITVAPGSDKAILTLADGRQVSLTDAPQGLITNEKGILIKKSKDGELTYDKTPIFSPQTNTSYNELKTPRGGQYRVVLPDGTRVFLNAASSIRYPASFAGKERRIFVTGEAYFDVAADTQRPFVVQTREGEVVVMGTTFNVNSYMDEMQVAVTLESGAILVKTQKQQELLNPGQQTLAGADGTLIKREANMETALAWKNNQITFVNADIPAIMRLVSRWYDLDIAYPQGIPQGIFTGGISKQSDLSALLQILEFSHIRFKLEKKEGSKLLLNVLP